MIKGVFFDMDGTVADLYNSDNWLAKLRGEKVGVYDHLQEIPDMSIVVMLCNELQKRGVKIGVISWLGMHASKDYHKATRAEKEFWIKSHNWKLDICHIIKYGVPKHGIAKRHFHMSECVLFDDNVEVINAWLEHGGIGVLVKDGSDVIEGLRQILAEE